MEQDKKNVYIIGAGGFGRELELWSRCIPENIRDHRIIGFLDDNLNALDGYPSAYKVLGKIDDFEFRSTDFALISIADTIIKQDIFNRLAGRVRIYTFIAHSAIVADLKKIGQGSVICPNAIVSTNVEIGKCVTVNCGTQLGHDCVVGDYSSFMANVMIGGEALIGRGVYFGSQSALVPRKKICDSTKISAGSIVINSIKKPGVYFGNPAKLLFS
jgi:sugar O-acyltransferase (sialic acid O-acetyltransferase NeuD family)